LAAGDFERLSLSGQLAVVEREAAGLPVILMGSSMGGYLAALYAARHPEVQRLVLLAPAFDFAARWRLRLGEEAMEEWRRTGFHPVFHYGAGEEARVGYHLYEDALRYEPYPAVTQPTLVCHGYGDDVVPLSLSGEFVKRVSDARLIALDSDHELISVLDVIERETFQFLGLTHAGYSHSR
jgi:hypothetical protein